MIMNKAYPYAYGQSFFAIHPDAVKPFVGTKVYLKTTERGEFPAFISQLIINTPTEGTVLLLDLSTNGVLTISTSSILSIRSM